MMDWYSIEDRGSWLSLEGLAINPFHDLQIHNIPSAFKSLSHLLFSIFCFILYHMSPSHSVCQLVLHLSLFHPQSQGHTRQIDCTLIANVMMLQSTYLTCLINTTAATLALFSLSFILWHTSTHADTHSCTQFQEVTHSCYLVSLTVSAFSSAPFFSSLPLQSFSSSPL